MGRKPNPVIGEYFTRGPKLADSSNRYPHTCKLCGENFPKGRGEVLHKHITEKCPAITPEERINAALGFAGLHSGASAPRSMNLTVNQLDAAAAAEVATEAPENWSALRTLAEASRQVGENEMGVPQAPGREVADPAARQMGMGMGMGFEVQEQFTLENPPVSYENRPARERKESASQESANPLSFLTTEEKMEHLQAATQQPAANPLDSSDLSVAAAATARLTHTLMDPQLTAEHHEAQIVSPIMSPAEVTNTIPDLNNATPPQQPWGEMTYMTTNHNPTIATHVATIAPPNRGGTRMPIGNGTSTALIVVLAQTRVKQARQSYQLLSNGTSLVVSLWEDSPSLSLAALVTPRQPQPETVPEGAEQQNGDGQPPEQPRTLFQVVMIDQDKEDLPARMEEFLKLILPTLIQREPSHFMQVVLDSAQKFPEDKATGKILKLAIDLWGLIEILDRERGWYISEEHQGVVVPRGPEDFAGSDDQDIYNLITFQLSAATERRANNVSNKLISELQRCLENGKARIHFDVYLSILILLHCLEKTTWTFKVWEMDDFRQRWPLDRPPSCYVNQGHEIADLLKMLLTLRKAHPKTFRALDGRLTVLDIGDPDHAPVVEFFNALNLDYDDVVRKLETCAFSPETSRSLELHFCSHVLLPPKEGESAAGHHMGAPTSSGHTTPPPPPTSAPSAVGSPTVTDTLPTVLA
ncbi:hypothetical protein K4K55_010432 [Colletotrichum sp. SAR 10_96]|nr:hypothetical protein K4K55_010432 [Colletotrichum sp. SAR 10_96]